MKRSGPLLRKTPLRRSGKLRSASKKHARALREYSAKRKEFLGTRIVCEVCNIRQSTEVHHVRRRGRFLNDVSTWKAICNQCHRWAHDHPKQAREQGLLA